MRPTWARCCERATPLGRAWPCPAPPTVVLLGHEHNGVPDDVWDLLDAVIEIPMLGAGLSLNVAVAGSLVLYKLAGLS